MINTKHCQFCDHQKVDFKTGTICALTDRKPDFATKCANAKLDKKLESKIESINIAYEAVLKTKLLVYINFVVFLVIAVSVILAGYFLAQYLLNFRVIAAAPFIISSVGLLIILPLAVGPLNTYRNDLKLAKAKKDELDAVLNIYNIKYDITIYFGDKYHGTQDVAVDLQLKK
ncbi:hypothetical protein [Winogradskyella thalassocola]|uniref:Uncharacterized protein n=1 Tax=Winogradskyella thalassocola TaxID=262004 RepID=A0A1G8H361_9FLAO|nr:hypothetical protein [Winogradskyella thalassocola]SDI01074.1 hypothetical protein SAMN04489796_106115 [Winogradskyella thalassocola]